MPALLSTPKQPLAMDIDWTVKFDWSDAQPVLLIDEVLSMTGASSENDGSGDGDVDDRNVTEHGNEGCNTFMMEVQWDEVATVTSE